jgi:zinc transport system permease protein
LEFVDALFSQNFMQLALASALLSGAVCGLIGPVVLARNLSSVAGGIAHSVVGGMGVFVWLGLAPLAGAFVAAIVVALLLALPRSRNAGTSEARIQILWSIGMAIGIVFLAKTPGYAVDLMSYLFGNLLLASMESLFLGIAVLCAVLGLFVWRYRCLETICFDEEFARVIGLPVRSTTTMLYLAIALCVVVLLQSVGLILVISLMTIPAMMAVKVARSMRQMILICILLNWGFSISGLWLSFVYDLPTGSTIILCAGLSFLVWNAGIWLRSKRTQATLQPSLQSGNN